MIELRAGDGFTVEKGPQDGWFSKGIVFFQNLWKRKGDWTHAGVITSAAGNTVEALASIRTHNLDAYVGEHLRIIRWAGMTPEAAQKGMNAIHDQIGMIYPAWRLLLFMIPIVAKYVSVGLFPVCSELLAKHWQGAGCTEIGRWEGTEPDDCAAWSDQYPDIKVVFDGIWTGIL